MGTLAGDGLRLNTFPGCQKKFLSGFSRNRKTAFTIHDSTFSCLMLKIVCTFFKFIYERIKMSVL